MSGRPRWSYVQARLQARHGERLQEPGWRAIEAARSIDQFIERVRASSLRRFTDRMNARMSSHALEHMLRDAWRSYVAELAGWAPQAWRQAVLWTSLVVDLPLIDGLLGGETPAWTDQDPAFAALAKTDQTAHSVAPANLPLAALVAAGPREETLAARWYAHWRALWPSHPAAAPALLEIAAAIKAHVARLDRAGLHETSAPCRRELATALTRLFRRHGGAPAALFCHLALVALDLERLRGGLVRRRLFAPDARDAA
jgi:hypothetical protein